MSEFYKLSSKTCIILEIPNPTFKTMELSHQRLLRLPGKLVLPHIKRVLPHIKRALPHIKRLPILLKTSVLDLLRYVKWLGYSNTLDGYELVKLGIFNLLNFFQLLAGVFIFFTCVINKQFPDWAGFVAILPALVSMLVLYLNKQYQHRAALMVYFILHPVAASFVFMNGIHLGHDLYFILYGILAVFFLKDLAFMIFSICFSMMNFFLLSVVFKQFLYQLENFNNFLYLVNEGVAIVFIFYGLYLIKNENSIYQSRIIKKSNDLQQKNVQIQSQANKIRENAALLEKQTKELTELNNLKNKMFGIISHDLKAPMHAIRNLFNDVQQKKIPIKTLQKLIPEVVNDLNYTVGLMDNLLQWVKTQMQSEVVYLQKVDVGQLVEETVQLVRLQADRKEINIEIDVQEELYGIMDREMIHLVLRNLLSNAIKFTPENGTVSTGIKANKSLLEVYVRDTGTGIDHEALQKIRGNGFYTTKGTANESGTGLGLMLCKEYLHRNDSQLLIQSKVGRGSVFSFVIQRSNAAANTKKVA